MTKYKLGDTSKVSRLYSMFSKSVIGALSLSLLACETTSSALDDVIPAAGLLATKSDTQTSEGFDLKVQEFYQRNRIYDTIARSLSEQSPLASKASLEGQKLLGEGYNQNRLPQVSPTSSVDDDGDLIGRLIVEQVIFDNGRFKAGKKLLTADESRAFSDYLIEANEDIATGIDVYLRAVRLQRLLSASEKLALKYDDLHKIAIDRVSGGVGKRSESSLFEIRKLQTHAQSASVRAELQSAKTQLQTLTGKDSFSFVPQRFNFGPSREALAQDIFETAPAILRVKADVESRLAELEQAKANRLPALSFRGSLGAGTGLGLGADDQVNDARLGLSVSQPLYWGKNLNTEAILKNIEAEELRVKRAKRDAKVEMAALDQQINALDGQLPNQQTLIDLAEKRADNFKTDFRAGAATMVEAISLLETLKTLQTQYIDMEHERLSAELQFARILGVLGPVVPAQLP